ncbi:MAG: tetratricopeptide repeat protein [Weeksellaceae bacterium]
MTNVNILEQQAIDAAVSAQWETAIELNKQIVKENREDISSHLRLGFAYLQLNNLNDAKKEYKAVLKLQPKNLLASEHLEKIEILESKKKNKAINTTKYSSDLFLEVPGKTKTVHLVNLGQKEDLAGRNIGEEVVLKEKKRRLEVRTLDNEYIGCLPDDISKRLLYFVKEGSDYKAFIKEIDLTDVVLFVQELSKGTKVKQYPSFPSNPHALLNDIQHLDDEEEDEKEEKDPEDEDKDEDDEEEEEDDLEDNWSEDEEDHKDLEHIIQLDDEDEESEE